MLDEVQRAPGLFSYLQTSVDADLRPGTYVLTGSQQFGLLSAPGDPLPANLLCRLRIFLIQNIHQENTRIVPLQIALVQVFSDSSCASSSGRIFSRVCVSEK
jgi:hypothetical protein